MRLEKKKPRTSYHHGNLREAVLSESLTWIKKNGVESLSLREIAKKLGVTHSAPNKHFPKKESLLASLIEMGFIQFKEALLSAQEKMNVHPKEAFIQMGVAYFRFANENPEIYRLMFSNVLPDMSLYPACEKAGLESFEVLHQAVIYLQASGHLHKGDSLEISFLIWSLTHGYVLLAQEGRLAGIDSQSRHSKSKFYEEELFKKLLNQLSIGISNKH
jgi:AcrR family transcriptional regulator